MAVQTGTAARRQFVGAGTWPWLAGIFAALGAVLLVVLFARTVQSQPAVDFAAYYRTVSEFRGGAHLYDQALVWRDAGYAVNLPGNDSQNADGLPFVYPPTFAFAILPLTLLPYQVALLAWFAIIAGSLVGTSHLLIRLLLPLERRYHAALVIAVTGLMAVFQPIRGVLATGNVDTLILFLLTLSLVDYRAGKNTRAGVWLALAGLMKPTVGFVLLFFLIKRAWRVIVACGVVGTLLLGASAAAIGPGQTLDFVSVATYWSSPAFAVSPVNQAPYGLLLRLFTPNAYTVPMVASPLLATVLRIAVIGVVLLVLARSISRSPLVSPSRFAQEYGLVLIGMLMASPLSEDIHYTYLALPLLTLAATAITNWRRPGAPAVAAGITAICIYLSLPMLHAAKMAFYAFYEAPVGAPRLFLTGVHVYALLALLVLAVASLRWSAKRRAS
jgi:hypothetical protein